MPSFDELTGHLDENKKTALLDAARLYVHNTVSAVDANAGAEYAAVSPHYERSGRIAKREDSQKILEETKSALQTLAEQDNIDFKQLLEALKDDIDTGILTGRINVTSATLHQQQGVKR